jgi:polysaccharide deacetylase 2 family uncharacterized protein YibQ
LLKTQEIALVSKCFKRFEILKKVLTKAFGKATDQVKITHKISRKEIYAKKRSPRRESSAKGQVVNIGHPIRNTVRLIIKILSMICRKS